MKINLESDEIDLILAALTVLDYHNVLYKKEEQELSDTLFTKLLKIRFTPLYISED